MRPLRILYDLASFDPSKDDDAAQRYAKEIARSLSEAGLAKVRIVGGRRTNGPAWLRAVRRRLDAREVAKAVADFKPDVVHRAGHTTPAGYRGPHRLFSTFNDVTSVTDSASSFESVHGHMICPNESVRIHVIRVLGLSDEQVSVVPPGVHPPRADGANRAGRGSFFLFVGPRSGPGNFDSVLRAVATTPTLSDIRVVALGGGPFSDKECKHIASLGLTNRVSAISRDEEALAGNYSSALALVYPSLYEGFGLPVLEAMAHSCPVACSRTSSLPEVGGDAALYFDPTDPADIATALVHLAADAGLRDRLAAAGRTRALQFTWRASTEKTLEVYRALLAER